jgi:hypothetical protein
VGPRSDDIQSLRELPILPGESLGGFRIGSQISDYEDVLVRESLYYLNFRMSPDSRRLAVKPWGQYREPWGLAITLWPVMVHVDIRDSSIYRVDALPGYDGGYNGIKIGMTWTEALQLEPLIEWDTEHDALEIPGTRGLFFDLSEDDPIGPAEYVMHIPIGGIAVFDVAKGTSLGFPVPSDWLAG